MAKLLHVVVRACEDCPWHEEDDYGEWCANGDTVHDHVPADGIAEHCPLPDAEETHDAKA